MRPLALPLGLSLAAHALLLALLCWVGESTSLQPRAAGSAEPGPKLSISLVGWSKPQPKIGRPRPDPHDWEIDLHPAVLLPRPVNQGSSALPVLPSFSGQESRGPSDSTGNGGGSIDIGGSARGGALSPGTGSAVLPVPAQIRRVVYLLDRSVSMGPTGALDRARRELALSLRALPPETLFQVFAYNRFLTPLVPSPAGLCRADPSQIALAIGSLDDLTAAGGTDHVAALRRGLALRPEVLFLLTDADDLTDEDVLVVTRANQGGTKVQVIELSRPPSAGQESPLVRLARHNHGNHRYVDPLQN